MNRPARPLLLFAALAAAAVTLRLTAPATAADPPAPVRPAAPVAAVDVTFIPAAEVRAGFARGAVLLDGGRYMVHASRREAAGQAEVHDADTDIIYVLEGGATLVTGGAVVEGRPTTPGELRGSRIEGGTPRHLAPGDLIVVPQGTPHWFKEVTPPFLYYVVKVHGGAESVAGRL